MSSKIQRFGIKVGLALSALSLMASCASTSLNSAEPFKQGKSPFQAYSSMIEGAEERKREEIVISNQRIIDYYDADDGYYGTHKDGTMEPHEFAVGLMDNMCSRNNLETCDQAVKRLSEEGHLIGGSSNFGAIIEMGTKNLYPGIVDPGIAEERRDSEYFFKFAGSDGKIQADCPYDLREHFVFPRD